MGSVFSVNAYPLNHKVATTVGVMERECREILQRFFEEKRRK
jgi:tRNA(Arg) A34 adenosine deaminase TadA